MNKKVFLLFAGVLVLSLACSFSFSSGDGSASEEPPTNVLFSDDFSDPSTGWGKQLYPDGTLTGYANGQYQIIVNPLESFYWGFTGRTYPNDVSIEVDVTPQAGSPEFAPFGIMCRYSEAGDIFNFYMLTITNNGSAAIMMIENSNLMVLSEPFSEPSAAITTGAVTNHLRADCIGNTLTLYVNDTQVVSVTDSTIASGDVGLVAGTINDPGVNVFFDNFVVTRP